MNKITCVSCGKTGLVRNEIGINKKLLGEDIEKFYCLDCLAEYLEVTPQDILDKIEEFKEDYPYCFGKRLDKERSVCLLPFQIGRNRS